jgi:hypothetical protein
MSEQGLRSTGWDIAASDESSGLQIYILLRGLGRQLQLTEVVGPAILIHWTRNTLEE